MDATLVIPWRPGCEHRERARDYVLARYAETYDGLEIIEASGPTDGPFNRSAAILQGAVVASHPTVIAADSDVWLLGDLAEAVDYVNLTGHWAVPHYHVRRLSPEGTTRALSGAPLSASLPTVEVHKGNPTGTMVVMPRELVLDVPPDVRFRGWGQEDEAWGAALERLMGRPWRGGQDLYHLWHPPAERMSRVEGNPEGVALRGRYDVQARSPSGMRRLVDESKALWPELGIMP